MSYTNYFPNYSPHNELACIKEQLCALQVQVDNIVSGGGSDPEQIANLIELVNDMQTQVDSALIIAQGAVTDSQQAITLAQQATNALENLTFQLNQIAPLATSANENASAALVLITQVSQTAQNALEVANSAINQLLEFVSISESKNESYDELIGYFSDTILEGKDKNWIDVSVTPTGVSLNGGTVNTTSKTVSIPSGSTGIGTTITQSFNLSGFPELKTGDVIQLRASQRESSPNAIQDQNFLLSLKANGQPVVIDPVVSQDENIINYVFDYTVQSLNNLEVSFKIGDAASASLSSVVYTWDFLDVFIVKNEPKDAILSMSNSLSRSDYMYTFFERSAVISRADSTGIVDNKERIQDEFDKAYQISGEIVFQRGGTVRISDTIYINGGVSVIGNGVVFDAYIDTTIGGAEKELFRVNTAEKIIIDNIGIIRTSGGVIPTSIKFSPDYINKGSVFKNLYLFNLPNSLNIDYVVDFKLENSLFVGAQNSISIGFLNDSCSDVNISKCRFENINLTNIRSKSAKDLTIKENIFTTSAEFTPVYTNRNIELNALTGSNRGMNIIENKFLNFRSNGIFLNGTADSEIVTIANNTFKDMSTSIVSIPIEIGGISNMILESNNIRNKTDGIKANGIDNLHIRGNNIVKETGTFAASRGLNLVNCNYISKNIITAQALANDFTGSTILTEA